MDVKVGRRFLIEFFRGLKELCGFALVSATRMEREKLEGRAVWLESLKAEAPPNQMTAA